MNNEPVCLNSKGGRNGKAGLQPSLTDRIYDTNGVACCITTSSFFMPCYLVNKTEVNMPKELGTLKGLGGGYGIICTSKVVEYMTLTIPHLHYILTAAEIRNSKS